MPKAEVGSTKWLGNKMKAKGLQRLRWYCQVCEKQMRDANGFKQHTMSESHVRQMQVVGQNANKFISDYSNQFKNDFIRLLRTSHGEKKININHFYQEYIANKEHIHMNATKWPSLTEFAKSVGREGVCRVEEGERGLEISWIDNSPDALRRQAAIKKRERQDKGDEEREQRLVQAQIERANRDAASKNDTVDESPSGPSELQRSGEEKIKLNFAHNKPTSEPKPGEEEVTESAMGGNLAQSGTAPESTEPTAKDTSKPAEAVEAPVTEAAPESRPKFSFASAGKPKNVFATASKKNALSSVKPMAKAKQEKPMSEAERIMREELERKRRRDERDQRDPQNKRIRL